MRTIRSLGPLLLICAAASLAAFAIPVHVGHAYPYGDPNAPRPVHDDILLAQLDASAGVQVAPVLAPVASATLAPVDPTKQAADALAAVQARNWPALVIAACTLLAFALRKFTPSAHFFHTTAWQMLSTGIAIVLDAGAQAIAQSGFNWVPIAVGAIGGLMAWLAQSKPVAGAPPALVSVKP